MEDNNIIGIDEELINKDELQKLRDAQFIDVNAELDNFFNKHRITLINIYNDYLTKDGIKAEMIYIDPLILAGYRKITGHHFATQPAPFRKKYIDKTYELFEEAGYDINKDGQLILD